MPFKFNGLTGQLDLVSSPTTSTTLKYLVSFNNTTQWTLNGSYYEFLIPASTHGAGVTPITQVFEVIAGVSTEVLVDLSFNALGDIVIRVTSVPDNRFTGKVIVF